MCARVCFCQVARIVVEGVRRGGTRYAYAAKVSPRHTHGSHHCLQVCSRSQQMPHVGVCVWGGRKRVQVAASARVWDNVADRL